MDGEVVFADFDAPYEYSFSVPAGVSTLRIDAVATDGGGNQASAPEGVVSVDPNSAPAAAFLALVAGQAFTEGTVAPIAVEATDDHGVAKVEIYVGGVLRSTGTQTPCRFDYSVPNGVAQFSVSAIAYDDIGPSETARPVVVAVLPDQPPLAEVIEPRDGQEFVEGTEVFVFAGVSDDAGVRTVSFQAGGVTIESLTAPPYLWSVIAPAAGETLRLRVLAEDTRRHQTFSPEVVIVGISDPLTTIQDRTVAESGNPVVGARVEAGGVFMLSGEDGAFSLVGQPTTAGEFLLSATAVVDGFVLRGFLASAVPPVPAGITEVGDLVLARDDPGAAVTGQTVDEAGSPVSGATVKIYDSYSVFTATSGADGRFTVAGAPSQGTLMISASAVVVEAAGGSSGRLGRAYEVRMRAAKLARERGLSGQHANADEDGLPGRIACYSKGLPHNSRGEVDGKAYEVLLRALKSGRHEDFERVPLGGFVKLANPQAALAFDLLGPDSSQLQCPPAPGFSSPEQAGELIGLYWQALLRDVPFGEYEGHPLARKPPRSSRGSPISAVPGRRARSHPPPCSGATPRAISPGRISRSSSGCPSPSRRSASSRRSGRRSRRLTTWPASTTGWRSRTERLRGSTSSTRRPGTSATAGTSASTCTGISPTRPSWTRP